MGFDEGLPRTWCDAQPWQADFFLRATFYLVVTLVVMGTLGAATVGPKVLWR